MIHELKAKLNDIRLKRKIIKANKNSDNTEIQEVVNYLRNNKLEYFNYSWFQPKQKEFSVFYDEKYKMHYVIYSGYRMYMKKSWNENRCKEYFSFLLSEQDKCSPHKYLDNEITKMKMDTIIDGGGAEGSFALSLINQCKEIFIIECDEEWIEALHITFKEFKDKVHIVAKLLGNSDSDKVITIDSLCQRRKIDLIKMDIEGDELKACQGSLQCIEYNPQIIFLICVYHYQDEENDIRYFFENIKSTDYRINCRRGYIFFLHDSNQKPPYLRRGVLKVSLTNRVITTSNRKD